MSTSKSIVYFGYLGDEDTDGGMIRQRLSFMDRQLRWLSDLMELSGERIGVLVPYVAPRAWDEEVHRVITRHGFRIDPASVRSERRNGFEYPGFLALKTLAEESDPDDLIYYCHSKGIMRLDESKMGLFRMHTEVGIMADLGMLTADSSLTRAGIFPYRFGWCWYNFFWIKAGYMAGLAVEESTDRYHFEALIGDRSDKEGYRGVLPLIDRLPFEDTGIAARSWYRAEETSSPVLFATYDRYAAMQSPADSANARRVLEERRAQAGSKPRPPLSLACLTGLFGKRVRAGKPKV